MNPVRDLVNVTPGTARAGSPVVLDEDKSVEDIQPLDMVHTVRVRSTIAEVNAGKTLVAAQEGLAYRMVDCALIAIGGDAAAVTSVDILATSGGSSRKLMAGLVAGLTRSTLLRAGAATNGVILADGASFTANDVNDAITIGKTGSDVTTATHIDVILSYAVERG